MLNEREVDPIDVLLSSTGLHTHFSRSWKWWWEGKAGGRGEIETATRMRIGLGRQVVAETELLEIKKKKKFGYVRGFLGESYHGKKGRDHFFLLLFLFFFFFLNTPFLF